MMGIRFLPHKFASQDQAIELVGLQMEQAGDPGP